MHILITTTQVPFIHGRSRSPCAQPARRLAGRRTPGRNRRHSFQVVSARADARQHARLPVAGPHGSERTQNRPGHRPQISRLSDPAPEQGAVDFAPAPPGLRAVGPRARRHESLRQRPGGARCHPPGRHATHPRSSRRVHQLAERVPAAQGLLRTRLHAAVSSARQRGRVFLRRGGTLFFLSQSDQRFQASAARRAGVGPRGHGQPPGDLWRERGPDLLRKIASRT